MDSSDPTRRDFLKTVGSAAIAAPLAAGAGGGAPAQEPRRRPNVILVMTDDQGYGDLRCLGNEVINTPHCDRLYEQSVRLVDFHVAPTCAPTRAGLMTGRYCNRTGVWHTIMGRSILRGDEVTMADVFGASGYQTGIFGKWHLGDNYPSRPEDRGFTESLVHGGGGVGQTPDFWGNDYTDDTYWHNGTPTPCEGYCSDVFFSAAMDFAQESGDEPFFAYVPLNAAHTPYNIADEWVQPYRDAGLEARLARFYGIITNIDWNMGRLMDKLDELGIADDTILIFMTDNGTGDRGFNAGMRGRKGSEYEGGHRVPFFMRWANGDLVEAGTDVGHVTANIDLLPTFIELCGLDAPEVPLDGESIASLLRGDDSDWQDRFVITDSQRLEHPVKWRKSSVMTDRWRLVNGEELYDIRADPGQESDVAADHPDAVASHREAYEAWWASVSERFGEYCPAVVGTEHEPVSRLTCHDWHEGDPPWNQTMIKQGPAANGFWVVDIAEAGDYEIALRRWPEEADAPITSAIDGGDAIQATSARLTIGDVDVSQPIDHGAKAVTFSVSLPAGEAKLKTWFTNDAGEDRGAYYAYLTRVEG